MKFFALIFCLVLSTSALAVTGNGTGSQTQITGGGTGGSTQVTGNGTGSQTNVTGGGTGSPQALEMDACMSGSFYDPANPGEGINVEVLEDTIVVYFYDLDGSWMFLQGDEDSLNAFQNANGRTYDVGSGYFEPIDNDNVFFGFDLLLDIRYSTFERPIPWCLRSDCERDFEFVRLTQPIPCAEEASTEVTGTGTGSSVQVTGTGTGSSVQVTGTGTGSSTKITGGGTGSSTKITGGGTGSSVQVTGGGTGSQ